MSNLKYFKTENGRVIFVGKKLECFIPLRYEIHGGLTIEDTVSTIGFFDMVINGTIESGLRLAAIVEIIPTETEKINIDGQPFLKLTLYEGDIFLKHTSCVQSKRLSYILFYEMTNSGHYPKFIKYNDLATLYDYISATTGLKVDTNHAITEMVSAQLARDSADISKLYRHTPMTKDPKLAGLRSIAQVASSATGKISGAYMKQGVQSVIAGEASTQNSEIEDLLRS